MTKQVHCGSVAIGGGAPVSVQSMTNTDTRDVEATLSQIRALRAAGADIVRVSVYDEACVRAVRTLVDASPVPLVADIHFDYRLALGAAIRHIRRICVQPRFFRKPMAALEEPPVASIGSTIISSRSSASMGSLQ